MSDPLENQLPTIAAVVRDRLGVSWTKAKKLCIEGRVSVGGVPWLDPAARVPPGSDVVVDPFGEKRDTSPLPASAIVYCDSEVVVIDKPPGLLSVSDGEGSRETAADFTRTLLRQSKKHGADTALSVVHRLDRDTSGLMMFTRSALAKRVVAEQFREHIIERAYLAIVHGVMVGTMTIDTDLVTDRGDGLRGSTVRPGANGDVVANAFATRDPKRAITHVTAIEQLEGAALVECRLETGRQHQIRIHLSERGHALVGERVYIRDHRGPKITAPRTMLHARMLGFSHPRSGKAMSFEREPPEDFQGMVESLRRA